MSEENQPTPPAPQQPRDHDMEAEQAFQWMRGLMQNLILAVFLLTGTMFIFIYREVTIVREQAKELDVMVTDFKMNTQPVIDDLKAKLAPFARANADFLPLYMRYFGTNAPEGSVKK